MAKFSKKPKEMNPVPQSISRFIFDELENAGIFAHPEPIVQVPNLDMYSTKDELLVEVELPGVRKEDIEVSVQGKTLTIKALKFDCFEENKVNYVCMERLFGKMYREIELPYAIDTNRVSAIFKNGLLKISAPKIDDKRARQNRIKVDSHD